jgi:hypothetical protein
LHIGPLLYTVIRLPKHLCLKSVFDWCTQVAEERLVALERRSEELRERAQDCHEAVAKRCRNDSCFKKNESGAFCSQEHVSELKKRCQLLNCMQV